MELSKESITLDKIASTLNNRGEYLKPCKSWEVKRIEEELNISLPIVYKEFLILMGKGAGSFMLGSSCFYKHLLEIQFGAMELLEENGFQPLPPNSFVFWMHQGYQFAFFLLDGGDDPPVYYYTEVNQNDLNHDFLLIEESFTKFLYSQLEEAT